jgi:hypothetical protein
MTTRLLSFLLLIEDALSSRRGSSVTSTRMVNYHKGLARLALEGGGVVHLQNFSLADGQICLKAALYWPSCEAPATHSLYPQEDFDWRNAASRIAEIWLAGPEAAGLTPALEGEAQPALEKLAAVG